MIMQSATDVPENRILFPETDFCQDVPDFEARMATLMETDKRVVIVRFMGTPAWLIFRHADVAAAYQDYAHLPTPVAYAKLTSPVMGRNLFVLEGDEHRVKRTMVARPFLGAALRQHITKLLRPLAHELIDAFGARRELDIVTEFTQRYPLLVITRLLGIAHDDEDKLIEWVTGLFSYPFDPDGAMKASAEFTSYLRPIIHAKRAAPADDLLSTLALAEFEGQRLDDEDILAFVRLLFPAGSDTTYLIMGRLLAEILQNGDLRRLLTADPTRMPDAVEEGLRLFSPVCLQPRFTETGLQVGDVDIPPHSVVLFGTAPSNRDPAVYPDPHRFDIDRRPKNMNTFGGGAHFCLGNQLARAELAVALEILLARVKGLRLRQPGSAEATHAVLRGVREMPVVFDDVLPAQAGVAA